MANLVTLERITLKNSQEINEAAIQQFIFDNPAVLGLGDLVPIQREKIQPSGGRLDILMGTEDNSSRYEIEIQLGATDPSHMVRTIEYWDIERKRYPQYDHCAVIVAEEITGRFLNVISLFNGAIPLIALQLTAYKSGEEIVLVFTKVLDRISIGTEEEVEVPTTDRAYWIDRSTEKIIGIVDKIWKDLSQDFPGYELKYNKFYIGLAKNGVAKNFISFMPKKKFLYFKFKTTENPEFTAKLKAAGLDPDYESNSRKYCLSINSYEDYDKNADLIKEGVKLAKEYYNISD